MNRHFLIVFILTILTTKGFCGLDVYSFKTYGNLSAKIEYSTEEIITDKAFKCAEFCSYITNALYPGQKVYLEIYTLRFGEGEDFFVSYDNGRKEIYENYNTVDKKGAQTSVRKYVKTDSTGSNKLIIRYVSLNPDYKKLSRFIYSSILKLDFIKQNQTLIEYKWFNNDWVFNSVDTIETNFWRTISENDLKIETLLKDKSFMSEICKNQSHFAFTYQDSVNSITILEKTDERKTGIEFESLIWFAIREDLGVFVSSDSTFYIADSKNKKISKKLTVPVRFSSFQKLYFSKRSKYAVEFSMINFDNVNLNHQTNSFIYRPNEDQLINVSEMDKKEIDRICKKTYWH